MMFFLVTTEVAVEPRRQITSDQRLAMLGAPYDVAVQGCQRFGAWEFLRKDCGTLWNVPVRGVPTKLAVSPRWGWMCALIQFQGLTPLAIDCRPVGPATDANIQSCCNRPKCYKLPNS